MICRDKVCAGGVVLDHRRDDMDLSLIYRIAGVGILIAILNIFLQQAERKDQAQMLSLAGVILVLLWLVQLIARLFEQVESVFHWY